MGVFVEAKFRLLKPVCYWKIKLWSWIWLCLGVGLAGVLATGCAGNAIAPGPAGAQRETQGAVLGSYEVIRYNAEGRADPALNHTLALRSEGDALVISVRDSVLTGNVLLDVRYDSARVHPVATKFHDLLGAPSQVLSAAFMEQAVGLAGIGACAIGEFKPETLDGDFASVTFAHGALRTASAIGDVYRQPAGVGYLIEPQQLAPGLLNLQVSNISASVRVTWYNAWLRADGTQDGECDIADLTPLGAYFGQVITHANFKCVPSDYSNDGIITYADLVPLSIHFGERCDEYVIKAADNTDGAARTYIATKSYYDSTPKAGAPVYPDLSSIYRSWQIDFTPGGQYALEQLAAIDLAGNVDGMVRLYITPSEILPPASTGTEAYVEFAVPLPDTYATVTGFDILAEGASGGSGAQGNVFAEGRVATVAANHDLSLRLNAVSGKWLGEPYVEGTFPAGMTQADYDAIHAAVADSLAWAISNNDDPEFRDTGHWFVSDSPSYQGQGDPGPGRVFPDDDPRLGAADPEGVCEVTLPAGMLTSGSPGLTLTVPVSILCQVRFDATPDPLAPLNEGYYSEPELINQLHSLDTSPGATTNVYCNMLSWGASGSTLPANGAEWQVWLCNVYPTGEVTLLTTIVWDAQADADPEPGEFSFYHAPAPLDADVFVAEIPGLWLTPGSYFLLRIFDGTTWSSLNKPIDLLDCFPPG
jgi:hypothetical protein